MTDAYGSPGAAGDTGAGSAPRTAYDRLGGAPAVSAVVDQFYDYVLADPRLRRFFVRDDGGAPVEKVELARLKGHFKLLVATLLGGAVRYEGRNLAEAHRGLGITSDDYDRVCDLFVGTLWLNHVPADIIAFVAERLAALKPVIVEIVRPAYAAV